ncbi:MAG: PASTA domain-containing protein [Bacteroidales bacterium]|nr:PASTA domain-containing protein [Bacteroidales bacterium]
MGIFSNEKWGWIARNLLFAAAALLAVVLAASFFLAVITKHDKVIELPDFQGMTLEEAQMEAASIGVRVDVRDSIYTSEVERGCVFIQNPSAGSAVKEGRRVLLTMNAHTARRVRVPNIVDLTLYEAEARLVAAGLVLGAVEYVPASHDRVISQLYNGSEIRAGRMLDAGSGISVQVGQISEDMVSAAESTRGGAGSAEDVGKAAGETPAADDDVEIDF